MINRVPLSGNNLTLSVEFDGVDEPRRAIQWRSATPDYFRTIGIPLREGRTVAETDTAAAPLVAVIDDRLAHSLWPGQSAVGKRFRVTFPAQPTVTGEIVGVVGNIRHQGLDSQEDRQIYFSYQQFTDGRTALIVRMTGGVRSIAPSVQEAIRTLDPEQPVYDVGTMDDMLARSAAPRWLNMAVVAAFAMSSLLLAAVGLYGVIALGVTERVREFGVRLALGASPSEVARLVVGQAAILIMCGAVPGLVVAVMLTRGIQGLVYGISPLDPASFAAAGLVLLAVALVASYIPARRAAHSDPTAALRGD
jgi:predicted permease